MNPLCHLLRVSVALRLQKQDESENIGRITCRVTVSGSPKAETQWFTQYLEGYLYSQGARNTLLLNGGLDSIQHVYVIHAT